MPWGLATIAIGAAGAAYQADQAGDAADAQVAGSNASITENRRQFDINRADTADYRAIGGQAVNALGSIYGYAPASAAEKAQPTTLIGDTYLPDGTTTIDGGNGWYQVWNGGNRIGTLQPGGANGKYTSNGTQFRTTPPAGGSGAAPGNALTTPDYSAFFKSPDYEFRRSEGNRNINNSFAARGGALSGNALRALTEYNSNLAAGEFGNYFNRQAALAGIGQTANSQSAQVGMATTSNIGNALTNAGNARASGIVDRTNALTGGIADLAGMAGYYGWGKAPYKPNYSTPGYGGGKIGPPY